jgi:hypothetical protein
MGDLVYIEGIILRILRILRLRRSLTVKQTGRQSLGQGP